MEYKEIDILKGQYKNIDNIMNKVIEKDLSKGIARETPREVKVINVIETVSTRGNGVNDPVRLVTQLWSFDGELLADSDNHLTNLALQQRITELENFTDSLSKALIKNANDKQNEKINISKSISRIEDLTGFIESHLYDLNNRFKN